MKYLIFSKYLQINLLESIIISLIIISGVFLTFIINRHYKNKLSQKLDKNIFIKLKYILWLGISTIIFLMIIPDFKYLEIIKFNRLLIKPYNIILIALIIFLTLLITRFVKIYFNKKNSQNKRAEKRSLFIIISLFWFISISIIFKTIIIDFNEISDYVLFSIKEIPVTPFVVFFLIFISAITSIVLIMLNLFFHNQVNQGKIEFGTSAALFQIIKYLLWILTFTIALETAGFKLSILLAGSAALLVGLGLGIKQIFGDIASGVVILIERTIAVGDIIEVNGIVGKVLHIGLRTTTIETRDSTQIIVPNSKFTNDNVSNWTHADKLNRFNISVGVAYGTSTKLVMEVLKESALSHENVEQKPEPLVIFEKFNEYSLDFKLHFWTTDSFGVERIKSEIRLIINQKFIENNIVIPFPIRTVQMSKNEV